MKKGAVDNVAELFIDGQWRGAAHGGTRQIRCPADGAEVAQVDEAGAADTEEAIAAARRAFDSGVWPSLPAAERGTLLLRTADLLRHRKEDFARAESMDTGKRIVESRMDMDDIAACFDYYGRLAGTDAGRVVDAGDAGVASRVVYEPLGVCGLITPWNFPLLQTAWKVAPALAAGNSFVLKPSELTPHTAILLLEILQQAGLPSGVGNLVLGAGPEAGAPLAEHPDVDLLSFTGGLATGRILMAAAAGTVKRVALELGGKNPNVIFADADMDTAIDFALTAIFLHSGQVCSAGSRLIVQETVHQRVVEEIVERAQRIRLGGPFEEQAETGPLISAAHREKVHGYVQRATEQGARLRCGGRDATGAGLDDGFYYLPTVLDECHSGMDCVHDESFGPVLTVETFATEEEAVAIANDTSYGLAGGVFTSDAGTAQRVAAGLRHGTVWINDFHPYLPQAEWGGFGQSGIGRELGPAGLNEYRETKHIYQNLSPAPSGWFGGEPGQNR